MTVYFEVNEQALRRCLKRPKIKAGFGGDVSNIIGDHFYNADGCMWFTVDGTKTKKLVAVQQKGRTYRRTVWAKGLSNSPDTYAKFAEAIEAAKPLPWR